MFLRNCYELVTRWSQASPYTEKDAVPCSEETASYKGLKR